MLYSVELRSLATIGKWDLRAGWHCLISELRVQRYGHFPTPPNFLQRKFYFFRIKGLDYSYLTASKGVCACSYLIVFGLYLLISDSPRAVPARIFHHAGELLLRAYVEVVGISLLRVGGILEFVRSAEDFLHLLRCHKIANIFYIRLSSFNQPPAHISKAKIPLAAHKKSPAPWGTRNKGI